MTDAPSADPRDALIREQAERLATRAERIAELETLVTELRERLETAERAGSRDSGNSSMPPGTDDLPGRKQRRGSSGGRRSARRRRSAESSRAVPARR